MKTELLSVGAGDLFDTEFVKRAHGAVRLTDRRAEGCEIVPPQKPIRPRLHLRAVERMFDLPDKACLVHEGGAATHQPKGIAALDRRKAGVPVIGNPRGADDCDRCGLEVEVERFGQTKRVPVAFHIAMGDLMRRMDARIGAARCGNGMGARFEFRQRVFDRALNRGLIGLPLPTCKGGAVIFDLKRITGHVSRLGPNPLEINPYTAGCEVPIYGAQSEKGTPLRIDDIARELGRSIETVGETLVAPFSDPVIRIGVTGLSRAGKTVFITSLVANLLDRGRMPQLLAAGEGRILSAYLQPQPDDTIPRFPYEDHLAAITSDNPHWPEGTRRVSELRLSLKVAQRGLLAGMSGPRTVHIDIVDYPGEWLLDLGLLDKSYAEWSAEALGRLTKREAGSDYAATVANVQGDAPLDEERARSLAFGYRAYLETARKEGFSDLTPGRFLLPGDLEGSPVLTFAPLHRPEGAAKGSLYQEFERRFESYKRNVVKPFYREHFARIDRQVVLVDVLGALSAGPQAFEDLRQTMADILMAFRPGRNNFLSRILTGHKVEKLLFAATKADHLHHTQHAALTALAEALLRDAKDRADFAGAATSAMSIAALRTTTEDTVTHSGKEVDVVKGRRLDTGSNAASFPGTLPIDPSHVLAPARSGARDWSSGGYRVMEFAPAPLTLRAGEGPPHIRLDRAAQYLIGDRL